MDRDGERASSRHARAVVVQIVGVTIRIGARAAAALAGQAPGRVVDEGGTVMRGGQILEPPQRLHAPLRVIAEARLPARARDNGAKSDQERLA